MGKKDVRVMVWQCKKVLKLREPSGKTFRNLFLKISFISFLMYFFAFEFSLRSMDGHLIPYLQAAATRQVIIFWVQGIVQSFLLGYIFTEPTYKIIKYLRKFKIKL